MKTQQKGIFQVNSFAVQFTNTNCELAHYVNSKGFHFGCFQYLSSNALSKQNISLRCGAN